MTKAVVSIYTDIEVGKTVTDVARQISYFGDNIDEIDVYINSYGGDVSGAEEVYNYIKQLDKKIPVNTIINGVAYSAASIIFLAGRNRIIEDKNYQIMIHLPYVYTSGTAEELDIIAKQLKEIENRYVDFYTSLLNTTKERIEQLLKEETYLSGKEAIELGFATELKPAQKAFAKFDNSKQYKKMVKDVKDEKNEKGFFEYMKAFFSSGTEPQAKALLELQTETAKTLVFPNLKVGDIPKVGDSATIDGVSANGEFIMMSLDENTLKFENGKVVKIIKKDKPEQVIAMLRSEIEKKEAEQSEILAKYEADKKDLNDKLSHAIDEIKGLKAKITSQQVEPQSKGGDDSKFKQEKYKNFINALNGR